MNNARQPNQPTPLDLARRAVACPGWRWMEGMRTSDGRIVLAVDGQSAPLEWVAVPAGKVLPCVVTAYGTPGWAADAWADAIPDLADPATLGCLLALVREVRGAPLGQVSPCLPSGGWVWYDNIDDGYEAKPMGTTEAAALVAALEVSNG